MAGGSWTLVYTATLGATITHTERNTEFQNVINNQYPAVFDDHSATLAQMRTEKDPYAGGVAIQPVNLGEELEEIRFKIGQIDDSLAAMLGVSANIYYYEDSPSGTISTSDTITNMPAGAYVVTTAQCTGRTILTNAGAGASTVTPTLPAGAANYTVQFNHVDSGSLVITPATGQALYADGVSLGAEVALTSKKKGAKYTCVWNSSGGWWEVNYYNTKVTAKTEMTSALTTTSTSWAAVAGATITLVCGVSGKVKVDAFFTGSPSTNAVRWLGIYRDTIGTENKIFGQIAVLAGVEATFGGVAEYTGLTPGTSYLFGIMWYVNTGTLYCSANYDYNKMVIHGETC